MTVDFLTRVYITLWAFYMTIRLCSWVAIFLSTDLRSISKLSCLPNWLDQISFSGYLALPSISVVHGLNLALKRSLAHGLCFQSPPDYVGFLLFRFFPQKCCIP